jgi:hypothetical protein
MAAINGSEIPISVSTAVSTFAQKVTSQQQQCLFYQAGFPEFFQVHGMYSQ